MTADGRTRKNQILVAINKLADSRTHVPPTMSEVAKHIGVSRQRVHQLAQEMRRDGELAGDRPELGLPGTLTKTQLEEDFVMDKLEIFKRHGLKPPPNIPEFAYLIGWTTSFTEEVVKRLKELGRLHESKWMVSKSEAEYTKEDYFWDRVVCGKVNECWPWKESTTQGYGHLLWNGKTDYAHRVAYVIHTGQEAPRDRSLHVGHTCQNKLCCNPRHLVVRTAADTAARRKPRQTATLDK